MCVIIVVMFIILKRHMNFTLHMYLRICGLRYVYSIVVMWRTRADQSIKGTTRRIKCDKIECVRFACDCMSVVSTVIPHEQCEAWLVNDRLILVWHEASDSPLRLHLLTECIQLESFLLFSTVLQLLWLPWNGELMTIWSSWQWLSYCPLLSSKQLKVRILSNLWKLLPKFLNWPEAIEIVYPFEWLIVVNFITKWPLAGTKFCHNIMPQHSIYRSFNQQ